MITSRTTIHAPLEDAPVDGYLSPEGFFFYKHENGWAVLDSISNLYLTCGAFFPTKRDAMAYASALLPLLADHGVALGTTIERLLEVPTHRKLVNQVKKLAEEHKGFTVIDD